MHGPGCAEAHTATGDRFKDVKNGLKAACEKATLARATWHTFRHTFASRLTRKGADLVTVKELLGHSTVVVTMRYAHTNFEAKLQAVKRLIRTEGSDKTLTVRPRGRQPGSDSGCK